MDISVSGLENFDRNWRERGTLRVTTVVCLRFFLIGTFFFRFIGFNLVSIVGLGPVQVSSGGIWLLRLGLLFLLFFLLLLLWLAK